MVNHPSKTSHENAFKYTSNIAWPTDPVFSIDLELKSDVKGAFGLATDSVPKYSLWVQNLWGVAKNSLKKQRHFFKQSRLYQVLPICASLCLEMGNHFWKAGPGCCLLNIGCTYITTIIHKACSIWYVKICYLLSDSSVEISVDICWYLVAAFLYQLIQLCNQEVICFLTDLLVCYKCQ